MNSNLAYENDIREELIGGEVVAMSPRPAVNHNQVAFNVANLFHNYLKGKGCRAFSDGYDLFLDEENNFVPDMMVVCDPGKVKFDGIHGAPDLVVEVLSPSTAKYDRGHKMRAYQRRGVRDRRVSAGEGGVPVCSSRFTSRSTAAYFSWTWS